ncbi:ketopantoate reductase family protein [Granulicella cerasi]|uniref:2-dehydropantoate 2-reductase n=1 Tax=Granulicella cerasi TaxID=741063 RepID=A0ABW1Z9E7_9BACT|nr:2-dehydropantoate 2-reductase [Granulicella cerasi]
MRILVVGAGATGGYYGGRLALAGRDVTFLVRGKRADLLRDKGLVIRTPGGDETLAAPQLIAADTLASAKPFDLILLSVKAYGFESAVNDLAPAVGDNTLILPLLNGMQHLDKLSARFGAEKVLGGFCRIVGDIAPDGAVWQMTPLNELAYGTLSEAQQARIAAVDATLKNAGFVATLSPEILRDMWGKWILLASLNAINILTRGAIGTVQALDEFDGVGTRLENRVMDEVFATCAAYDMMPEEKTIAMIRERLTEKDSTLESSMYRDFTRGYSVECDQILGDLVRRARLRAIDVPLVEAAFVQLRLYERARA